MNKELYPANVIMILDQIDSILKLDAIPKQSIIEWIFGSLASSVFPENGLLQKLGIFGFALAMCLIILILVLGIRRLVKIEKLRMILDKIKLMICWNMVIKCL